MQPNVTVQYPQDLMYNTLEGAMLNLTETDDFTL